MEIQKVSKNDIMRILNRAGVKRVSGLVYEEIRGLMVVYLSLILRNVVIAVSASKRHTVSEKDLIMAFSIIGTDLAVGMPRNGMAANLKKCKSKPKTEKTEDKRRRPSGSVSLSNIRYQQRASDCLAIRKKIFKELVKELSHDLWKDPNINSIYNKDIGILRFASGTMEVLQSAFEDHFTNLAEKANLIAISSKRQTVKAKDIRLARDIME